MVRLTLLLALASAGICRAQNFVLQNLQPDFPDFDHPSIAHGDLDNDGYEDLIMTGSDDSKFHTVLWRNLGDGTYDSLTLDNLPGLILADISIADVNMDGRQDFFISGSQYNVGKHFHGLYINQGGFDFRLSNSELTQNEIYESLLVDLDMDGDLDLAMIEGPLLDLELVLYEYSNDGDFRAMDPQSFHHLFLPQMLFGDIDGDGDQDLIYSGKLDSIQVTQVYRNDGTGVFIPDEELLPFSASGDIGLTDLNNDGYLNLVVVGPSSNSIECIAMLNRMGVFVGPQVIGVGWLEASFAAEDLDQDDRTDLVICGYQPGIWRMRCDILYNETALADSTLVFEQVDDMLRQGVYEAQIVITDLDDNGLSDILTVGMDENSEGRTSLYIQNERDNFIDPVGDPLPKTPVTHLDMADIDGDGHEDMAIRLALDWGESRVLIYKGDGRGVFRHVQRISVISSDLSFADVDQDGDQDLVLGRLGYPSSGDFGYYSNNGEGHFSRVSLDISPERFATVIVGDFNSDGLSDILQYDSGLRLYENLGNGDYLYTPTALPNRIFDGIVSHIDIEGDGLLDLFLGLETPMLYRNLGDFQFEPCSSCSFDLEDISAQVVADIDDDQSPDLVLCGIQDGKDVCKIYWNRDGKFHDENSILLDSFHVRFIEAEDVDLDGRLDVLLSGVGDGVDEMSRMWLQKETAQFTALGDSPFDRVSIMDGEFSDLNGDDLPELLVVGRSRDQSGLINEQNVIYINQGATSTSVRRFDHSELRTSFIKVNPVLDELLHVDIPASLIAADLRLELYDIEGRLVAKMDLAEDEEQSVNLNALHLAPGSYVVQLHSSQGWQAEIVMLF